MCSHKAKRRNDTDVKVDNIISQSAFPILCDSGQSPIRIGLSIEILDVLNRLVNKVLIRRNDYDCKSFGMLHTAL